MPAFYDTLLRPDLIITEDISAYFDNKAVVHVLRLDRISPLVSGNKWFKLRYYIDDAKRMQKKGIVTFGGAWSNHILATAATCNAEGLLSIGIIRGEASPTPSATLVKAAELGMRLVHVSRTEYASRDVPEEINNDEYLFVNEGGYGVPGALGAATILDHCEFDYTHYGCATGTGTMIAGLIRRLNASQQAIGISVLKNNVDIDQMIQPLLENKNGGRWSITHEYSFGGYAKARPELLSFMNDFYRHTGIPSDFVYTGKLFFAFYDLLKKNYFLPGSKILLIHSGGLQGNASLPEGTLMF